MSQETSKTDSDEEEVKRKFKCPDTACGKSFPTEKKRDYHVDNVHFNERVDCPYEDCDAKPKKRHLKQHIKNIHKKLKKKCNNCGKLIAGVGIYKHQRRCTSDGSRPFKCKASGCDKDFRTAEDRGGHMLATHSKPIECPFPDCSAMIKSCHLSDHVRRKHDKLKVKCKRCGCEVSWRCAKNHELRCASNGVRAFECTEDDCKATFITKGEMKNHVREVHILQPSKCPFPGCDVTVKTRMKRHIKQVHENIRIECQSCGKKFSYRYIKTHVLKCTSDGSRPFVCTEEGCSKTFKMKFDRDGHVRRVHFGQKVDCPFSDCKAKIKKESISIHVRSVHEKYRVNCKKCGKRMSYYHLNYHMKSCRSDGSRPYKCTKCDKAFITPSTRYFHMKCVHSKPIKCLYNNCDAMIKQTSMLTHVRLVHNKLDGKCKHCRQKLSYKILSKHLQECSKKRKQKVNCINRSSNNNSKQQNLIKSIEKEEFKRSVSKDDNFLRKMCLSKIVKVSVERIDYFCKSYLV